MEEANYKYYIQTLEIRGYKGKNPLLSLDETEDINIHELKAIIGPNFYDSKLIGIIEFENYSTQSKKEKIQCELFSISLFENSCDEESTLRDHIKNDVLKRLNKEDFSTNELCNAASNSRRILNKRYEDAKRKFKSC